MRNLRRAVGRGCAFVSSGAISLGMVACEGGSASGGAFATVSDDLVAEVADPVALRSVADCDALLAELQSSLIERVRARAEEARRGGTYYGGGVFIDDVVPAFGPAVPVGTPAPAPAPAPPPSDAASSLIAPSGLAMPSAASAPPQEGDVIKVDGERIYAVQGNVLSIVRAHPADAAELIDTIILEGDARELIVQDGHVVVFTTIYGTPPGGDPIDSSFYYYYPEFTKVTVIDVSGEAPAVVREAYVEGSHTFSRGADGVVRAVVRTYSKAQLDNPNVSYQDIFGRPRSQEEVDLQVDLWALLAMDSIEESRIEDYLPAFYERVGGRVERRAPDCSAHYVAGGLTQSGATSVVALDLDAPAAPLAAAILLSYADNVYADRDALVLHQVSYADTALGSAQTFVHRFELDGTSADYVASGTLDGYVNQLDQSAGITRAITIEDIYTERVGEDGSSSIDYVGAETRLVTLGARGGQLVELGAAPLDFEGYFVNARFSGERLYLATSDGSASELWVADLSDPSAPRVLGGTSSASLYSSVLVPLPDGLLAVLGEGPDPTGFSSSFLVQLFDAGAGAPVLVDAHEYEGYSYAVYDPRLLALEPRRNLLAFPLQDYTNGLNSLEVFEFSPDGLTRVGGVVPTTPELTLDVCLPYLGYPSTPEALAALEGSPELVASLLSQCRLYFPSAWQRGVFSGDVVFALSDSNRLAAYALDALAGPPLSEVALPFGYYEAPVLFATPPEATPAEPSAAPAPAARGDSSR